MDGEAGKGIQCLLTGDNRYMQAGYRKEEPYLSGCWLYIPADYPEGVVRYGGILCQLLFRR